MKTETSKEKAEQTISATTSSVAAVWHACTGGKFNIRLEESDAPAGRRFGYVLDNAGNIIGDASDRIYGGRGFAVHTAPYAGYVDCDQVQFVA